jgi:hypothetical protein
MKGLSVLLTMVLLVAAHFLALQLRRARALPAQHPPHATMAGSAPVLRASRSITPDNLVLEL